MDGLTAPGRRAILCSRNPNKARELERLLPGWAVEPLAADGYPPETGASYYENAAVKAAFGRALSGGADWVLGEDSGLEVEALDGRPGVHSARYAPEGPPAVAKLLAELEGVERPARPLRLGARRDRPRRDGAARHWHRSPAGSARSRAEARASATTRCSSPTGRSGRSPSSAMRGRRRTRIAPGPPARSPRRWMRLVASAAALAALTLAAAGCGGGNPAAQRTLDAFFSGSARGRAWGKVFPHRPGTRPCTARDTQTGQRVPATCSTDVSLVKPHRAVVTLTQAWNRGARALTWFVFVRQNGAIESVVREHAVPSG